MSSGKKYVQPLTNNQAMLSGHPLRCPHHLSLCCGLLASIPNAKSVLKTNFVMVFKEFNIWKKS